jgi:hypothetical protein
MEKKKRMLLDNCFGIALPIRSVLLIRGRARGARRSEGEVYLGSIPKGGFGLPIKG